MKGTARRLHDHEQLLVDHPVEASGDQQQSEVTPIPKQKVRFQVPNLAILAVGFFAGVGDVINVGGGMSHN